MATFYQDEREIRLIIIHCTATRANQHYSIDQLYRDHVIGRGFNDIGYHFYIARDGTLYQCRPLNKPGAHCKGFNLHSIGIAYEGGLDCQSHPADTRTPAQKAMLRELIDELHLDYPTARVKGHRDVSIDIHKDCPCFDVSSEY